MPKESTPITLSASPSKLNPRSAGFSLNAFFNGSKPKENKVKLYGAIPALAKVDGKRMADAEWSATIVDRT